MALSEPQKIKWKKKIAERIASKGKEKVIDFYEKKKRKIKKARKISANA